MLSSTWRHGWEQIENGNSDTWEAQEFIALRDKFQEFGIELYDKTITFGEFMHRRGEEVQAYLDSRDDVQGYVIIDDLSGPYLRPCSSHLLQTNESKGLQEKHIKIAERILNMEV